jgi:hypothetical protein
MQNKTLLVAAAGCGWVGMGSATAMVAVRV